MCMGSAFTLDLEFADERIWSMGGVEGGACRGASDSPRPESVVSSQRRCYACGMSGERLSVLIVAANASTRWAGEAILPLHIFQGLLKAGHDAWMCVGNETKPELDGLLGPDAQRVSYIGDAHMHSAFRWIQARTPSWMGSNPLYYPQVLATQWRQRGAVPELVKKLGIV